MTHLRHVIGKRIRLLRLTRGWSQEVLAELAELDRTYIGSIENGRNNISIDNVEKLAMALEVPVYQLMMSPQEETDSSTCPLAALLSRF